MSEASDLPPPLSRDARAVLGCIFEDREDLIVQVPADLTARARHALQELVIHGDLDFLTIGRGSRDGVVYRCRRQPTNYTRWSDENPRSCGWPLLKDGSRLVERKVHV